VPTVSNENPQLTNYQVYPCLKVSTYTGRCNALLSREYGLSFTMSSRSFPFLSGLLLGRPPRRFLYSPLISRRFLAVDLRPDGGSFFVQSFFCPGALFPHQLYALSPLRLLSPGVSRVFAPSASLSSPPYFAQPYPGLVGSLSVWVPSGLVGSPLLAS